MKLFIPFTIIGVVVTGIALVFFSFAQPVDKNDKTPVIFVVNPGEPVRSIANRLEKEGLVRNGLVFLLTVKRLGLEQKIQAGDFRLSKDKTPEEIANELTTGTLDVWIQIIEGLRAEEIAEILKEKIPTYENTWVTQLRQNEGRLFPDTYLIPKDADSNLIVAILTNNFDEKIAPFLESSGENGLSLEESIILASIVEREALFDEDRGIIAGILLNRLRIGMALQADAAVQYALGFQPEEKDWWKKSLTKDDFQVNSPFNTYRRPGLPPKPISNPGLASLKAVFTPTDTDYLYYLHDSTGRTHYGKTIEEHNENIQKYL